MNSSLVCGGRPRRLALRWRVFFSFPCYSNTPAAYTYESVPRRWMCVECSTGVCVKAAKVYYSRPKQTLAAFTRLVHVSMLTCVGSHHQPQPVSGSHHPVSHKPQPVESGQYLSIRTQTDRLDRRTGSGREVSDDHPTEHSNILSGPVNRVKSDLTSH